MLFIIILLKCNFFNLSIGMKKEQMRSIRGRTGDQEGTAGGLNAIVEIFHGFVAVIRRIGRQRLQQNIQFVAVRTGCLKQNFFCVVQFAELPFAVFILRDCGIARNIVAILREKDERPQFRIVNIDDTGRGPDPVVLRKNVSVLVGALYIGIVFDIYIPLNGKILRSLVRAVLSDTRRERQTE